MYEVESDELRVTSENAAASSSIRHSSFVIDN